MFEKIWNDPVGSKVISAAIIGLLTLVYSLATKILYAEVWSNIYNIKISIVYVALGFGTLLIFRAYYKRAVKSIKPEQNHIVKPTYARDKFGVDNLIWDWEFRWDNSKNAFIIENLTPLCPECQTKTTIRLGDYGNTAFCSKCKLEGNEDTFTFEAAPHDVFQAILRREKGEEKKQL